MRGLYINTDGTMKVVDYTDPQLQDLKEAIGRICRSGSGEKRRREIHVTR